MDGEGGEFLDRSRSDTSPIAVSDNELLSINRRILNLDRMVRSSFVYLLIIVLLAAFAGVILRRADIADIRHEIDVHSRDRITSEEVRQLFEIHTHD